MQIPACVFELTFPQQVVLADFVFVFFVACLVLTSLGVTVSGAFSLGVCFPTSGSELATPVQKISA